MAEHGSDVFHHIRDATHFELPGFLGGNSAELPAFDILGYHFQVTKFMVLQVVAGLLTLIIFWGLSRHVRSGRPARGRFWNFWEMLAVAIRDDVARPAIGTGHHHEEVSLGDGHVDHHDHGDYEPHGHGHGLADTGGHPADQYLPYIWSCFFYVLFCNLLGALPWLGSATGHLAVTVALAVSTLIYVIKSGSQKLGVLGYWKALIPTMDLPGTMALFLKPMIWVIELVGLLIKHGVLAVRLFANIMAGHTVIAVILGYIALAAGHDFPYPVLYWLIMPASIFGQLGIGMLELFVAFLQAYVFAFLAALFIGAAVHPH
ncbi:MAG: F0F1 ATP synthase subunit A [Planctomycetota bacterium]